MTYKNCLTKQPEEMMRIHPLLRQHRETYNDGGYGMYLPAGPSSPEER
jgi:hypothetical protein